MIRCQSRFGSLPSNGAQTNRRPAGRLDSISTQLLRPQRVHGGGRRDWFNRMTMAFAERSLPNPTGTLSSGEVTLRFVRVVPGELSRGFVPYYHFRILTAEGLEIGHINFRVGNTEHVRVCAGHIGCEIAEPFRGRGFASQACHAIAPFVRSICGTVTITCDPDNIASRRMIERLGAEFIDEVAVPSHDPHYQRGSRSKRRYRWTP
ncbi:MAG TPA: GNAT family N-acetyltransferase [Methylomirabilota bacterium]|nr:GNAT family N-acetyltransferase [Methylomirabilota bacterium]